MITLTDLRALLERALTHTENPAIQRLSDRTVEGVARAYLPRTAWVAEQRPGVSDLRCAVGVVGVRLRTAPLDLTDSGTAHALLVALALALGLDPGPLGLGVGWCRCLGADSGRGAWEVYTMAPNGVLSVIFGHEVCCDFVRDLTRYSGAPAVATEPDPVKALALAVRHVLEAS